MSVFLVWMVLLFIFVTTYILYLRNRKQPRSQFGAKITSLFIFFVLLPSIPLTFFSATLLTRTADMLLLPGIDHALTSSLETIQMQAEQKGITFFKKYQNTADWTPECLQQENIFTANEYLFSTDTIINTFSVHSPDCHLFVDWIPPAMFITEAQKRTYTSHPIKIKNSDLILVFQQSSITKYKMIAYSLPQTILQSKNEISHALTVYNTLSLLKHSILEKNIIWALAVIFILFLVTLTIIVADKISKGISQPVQEMVKGMKKVANGDLTYRVDSQAKDEFRFLVDSFNHMIEDIKTAREKLIQTERLAAWQEVARRISNEMKNSLTPISLSLRRLQTHISGGSSSQIKESLDAIEDELYNMEKMAGTFSAFSSMPEPHKKTVNLNDVVQSVLHILYPIKGSIQIQTQLSSNPAIIHADFQQLKQLLNNLIQNSLEASDQSGEIRIVTRNRVSGPFTIELEVTDKGQGMDQEIIKKIMQPYFTTKKKGTGLGLAIAQKIIEDHNGKIEIKSKKDQGTMIKIWL